MSQHRMERNPYRYEENKSDKKLNEEMYNDYSKYPSSSGVSSLICPDVIVSGTTPTTIEDFIKIYGKQNF